MENEKIKLDIKDVQETMLITLWAKAQETNRNDALIKDYKAVEIYNRIDYDFSKFKRATLSQAGCCIRAKYMDLEIQKYIEKYPDAVVIQLGAGIDARYQRLGCPNIEHWYDLDLPEVIKVRRQFIEESPQNTFIAGSMFDHVWMDEIKKRGKHVIIVAEGVLMYFKEDQIKKLFNEICQTFEKSTFIFDMLSYKLVGKGKKMHDSLSKMDGNNEFLWSLLESKDLENWNEKIHLTKEYYMSDYNHGRYPLIFRWLYKIPYFYKNFNQRIVILDFF